MTRKIEVVPYDHNWPNLFEEEATLLKQALDENSIAVHHVGSTSVPDLPAKPQIDIILVVKNTAHVVSKLEKVGYLFKGELNIPFRLYFSKKEPFKVNLHVYENGNPEIELNILFRDYLRTHPEFRKEYGALKYDLLSQENSHKKISGIFSGYNLGKDAFVKKILTQTGFNGTCMRFCTHYDEWEAVRTFRQKYFFDKVHVADPYTWTFDHKEHVHFVLYKGATIVGYVHLQLWPENRAALRIIVIDEPYRKQGFGGEILGLCEKWLKQMGFKTILTQSSPGAYTFYSKMVILRCHSMIQRDVVVINKI